MRRTFKENKATCIKKSCIFLACLFATVAMQAQSVAEWMQTARAAFGNSEYRTVLTNAEEGGTI
ncbi:MAG: hypothetical protein LBO74_15255 [Candidatus Symbiothrix sp.]|nr:hypothetical protein [Candidatus Symbiothrix sp.]